MSKGIRKTQIVEADTKTALYERIRELIVAAHRAVARGVDLVQVRTNFEIGRHIVAHEQQGERRAVYGKEVLKMLAERLTAEFGGGFSMTNLKLMRQFYMLNAHRISQTASDLSPLNVIGQVLSDQSAISGKAHVSSGQAAPVDRLFSLSWSHYVFLLGIKNPDERSFYEIEAICQNWALRELKRQFDSSLYERLALSRGKEGIRQLARKGQIVNRPKDLLKEPLVLEFLGLSEQARYSETEGILSLPAE
jgi:hypothetical protein